MAYASITYTSASGTTFALTNSDGNAIEYLRQSDISVTVNGTLQTQGTDYTFNSAGTSIILTSSVSNATVVISRTTTITDATVSFTAGSTLTAQDLNNSDRQNRFALQEFSDIYDSLRTGTGDLGDLGGFIDAGETWVSDAAHAATTNAIDARVDSKIDSALTGDVVAGNAITITDNSPASGQITVAVTDGAIEAAELASNAVTTVKIADSNVTTAKINDAAVTTAKINDAAVTTAKLANDSVTSAKIADGTIIAGDIASNAVTTAKILDANVTTAKIADSNVTTAKINDAAVTEAKIAGSAVTNAKIASGAVDSTKMSGATVVTNSEHSGSTPNDTSFFTTSASDARYFRQDSSETISSGSTWSGSDNFIATTAAIDARIIDLVDDVGGFVPIANETSFPAANPDLPDEAGTIISIKEITTTRTPSSGTVTIANGSGSNTVTINGCGSTVLASGFGVLVETTSTLHTYTFHRLVPKATEVTTVAGIASNVTTVANNASAVTTVANDLNETTSEIETVANSISNVDAVGGSIANVNTVASNISSVNSFANVYRIASSDPTTSLDVGDLVFNTTNNKLRIYNGSSWQDGVTATGDLVSKTGDTMTGALGVTAGTAGSPSLFISGDTNTGLYSPGADQVAISTNGTGRLFVDSSGNVGVGATNSTSTKLDIARLGGAWTGAAPSAGTALTIHPGGGTASSPAHLSLLSGNTAQNSIFFGDTDSASSGFVRYDHSADALLFGTGTVGGSERLRITSDGKVGLGTSSPAELLELSATDNPRIRFVDVGNTDAKIGIYASGRLGFEFGGTERMSLNSTGLGVGTTSPGANLDVVGSGLTLARLKGGSGSNQGAGFYITKAGSANTLCAFGDRAAAFGGTVDQTASIFTDASIPLTFDVGNSEKVRITSDGKLGIGTSSPPCRLAVRTEGADGITLQQDTGTSTNSARLFFQSSTNTSAIYNNNGNLFFNRGATAGSASGTTSMTITSGGSVGIGTTSPSTLLDVRGSTEASIRWGTTSNFYGTLYADSSLTTVNSYNSNPLTFSVSTGTGYSEKARIDTSGRLLVGTSSTSSAVRGIFQGNSSDNIGRLLISSGASTLASGDPLAELRFSDSGHVVAASIRAEVDAGWSSGTDQPSRLVFSTTADGASSPTERMRLDSNGVTYMNTTTNPGSAQVSIASDFNQRNGLGIQNTGGQGGGQYFVLFYNGANVLAGSISHNSNTTVAFNTSSDYRLKENITPVVDGITRLQQLKPSRFNFIADPDKTVDGFIAHEVQDVIPEAITGDKDAVDDEGNPVYQGIDQSKLVPLLTAALQEAIGRIETLEAEVAALKGA